MQIRSSKAVMAPNAKHEPHAHWSRIVWIDGHSGWAILLSNSVGSSSGFNENYLYAGKVP